MKTSKSWQAIYGVVTRIPRGRVSTYGRVAELAGLPRRARLVGRALRELPPDSDVPWHRVLNAAGRISPRGDALGHEDLQAQLLEREDVRLVGHVVPLSRYLWQPAAAAPRTDRRAVTAGAAGRSRRSPARTATRPR